MAKILIAFQNWEHNRSLGFIKLRKTYIHILESPLAAMDVQTILYL